MRYILNDEGYIDEIAFGAALIECKDKTCNEYNGTIPTGYTSLQEWATGEEDKLNAWKIVNGNLVFDNAKYNELQTIYEKQEKDNSYVTHKEIFEMQEQIEKIEEMSSENYKKETATGKVITIDKVKKCFPIIKLTNINCYDFNNIDLIVTGKNTLPNTAITQTINGVTFTQNKDRSITIIGQATADIEYNLAGTSTNTSAFLCFKKNINYYLYSDGYTTKMYNYDGTNREEVYSGIGELIKFTNADKEITQITLSIPKDKVVNETIYPMLSLKPISNKTLKKIYGKSTQDGTPTPETPVEIKSVPSVENLFNKYGDFTYGNTNYKTSLNEKGQIVSTSNYSTKRSAGILIENLKTNTDYSISGILVSANGTHKNNANIDIRGVIGTSNSALNIISFASTLTKPYSFKKTFNTDKYTSIWISFNGTNSDSTGLTNTVFDNLMLEEGSVAHPYVPYGKYLRIEHNDEPIFVNIEDKKLCSIGNIKDELEVISGKGIKRIKEYAVDINSISILDTYTNLTYIVIPKQTDDISYNKYIDGNFMFTHGIHKSDNSSVTPWDSALRINTISSRAASTTYWLGVNKGTTLEQAKEMLEGAMLYYELETPEEFTIEPVEISNISSEDNPDLEMAYSIEEYEEYKANTLSFNFSEYVDESLFASETLYPSDTLYPKGTTIEYILIGDGSIVISKNNALINIESEKINLFGGYNTVYTLQDTDIELDYVINNFEVENLDFLCGKETTNKKFKILEDASIQVNNIYMYGGAKVMGGSGLLTSIVVQSNIFSEEFVGGSAMLPLKTGDRLMFQFILPKGFDVQRAYVTINHQPFKAIAESTLYNGYCRNLKLYKCNDYSIGSVIYDYDLYTRPEESNMSYSEIPNAFGSDGFTGDPSTYKTAESIDITEYITKSKTSSILNILKIQSSNTPPEDYNSIFQATGTVNATLTILGYTNFE